MVACKATHKRNTAPNLRSTIHILQDNVLPVITSVNEEPLLYKDLHASIIIPQFITTLHQIVTSELMVQCARHLFTLSPIFNVESLKICRVSTILKINIQSFGTMDNLDNT